MSDFKVGDMVVLIAGSMRMAVEYVKDNKVSTVWCNEGIIGRDVFPKEVLKKWEYREEDKIKPSRGGSRGYDKKESRGSTRTEKQKGKTGWDGKAREKNFFRKG